MDKTSLGFQKPKEEEYYDINIFNQNAQLANDLIEKNSSAIGQKLDKDSSFYADLEAYYGNTKLIDDFQDTSKWILISGGTGSDDYINVKLGNKSFRSTENDNISASILNYKNIDLDLSILNNGEVSTNDDFIFVVFYISDVTKISPNVQVLFSNELNAVTANSLNYAIPVAQLVTGWNFIKIKKSNFAKIGNGSWIDIKSVRIAWTSTANAQNAYVSFQLIQLVKADPDTLLDRPNPFQKFGNIELYSDCDGEWVVYKDENDGVVLKEIKALSRAALSLLSKKYFNDFIISGVISTKSTKKRYIGASSDYSEFFYADITPLGGSQYIFQIYTFVGGVSNTKQVDLPYVEDDDAYITIERKGKILIAKLRIKGEEKTISIGFDTNNPMRMALGRDQGGTVQTFKSASISEISHSSHSFMSDISKVSNKVESENGSAIIRKEKRVSSGDVILKSLLMPKMWGYNKEIGANVNPIGVLKITLPVGWSNVMMKIKISGYDYSAITGAWELLLGGYNYTGGGGSWIHTSAVVKGKPPFSNVRFAYDGDRCCILLGLTTTQWQYPYISIDEIVLGANSYYSYEDGWDVKIITSEVGLTSIIEPELYGSSPKETVITSGFASGWSGILRVSKTQDGEVSVSGVVTRTSDLIVSVETVYSTLPLPTYTKNILVNLYNIGSASVGNSFCNLSVDIYGNLKVYPVAGTNLSGARQLYGFEIRYTAK